jgi:hypothetical protein
MSPVQTVPQVFDALQQVKADASAFCTNFFPVQSKLERWIEERELFAEQRDGTALWFRKNRDFWHLFFCATSPEALRTGLGALPARESERLVVDLVGQEAALNEIAPVLKLAGFRPYSRLQRMARSPKPAENNESLSPARSEVRDATEGAQATSASAVLPREAEPAVLFAEPHDQAAVLALLEASFEHYSDQLPVAHEIDAAIANRQILAVKLEKALAALLFFETQGFTSTLRFWAVAEAFRARRLGSVLMRHYFAIHKAVRRFMLWVASANDNAVTKYQHYGYTADSLLDLVLVNDRIP